MWEHFRYDCRSVGLLKRESSLRKVVDRSALRGTVGHMLAPTGTARWFREKSGIYGKSLEVSKILHMGCAIGNSGLHCRSRPVLLPPLLYHRPPQMSIGNLHKKKESFSTLFFDAVGCVNYAESFVTLEAGAQFRNRLTISARGIKGFVLGRTTIGAFNFHSITTNSFQGRRGCIRLCTLQRNCHPHSSYSRPHHLWFPARSGCTPHNSSTYSSS